MFAYSVHNKPAQKRFAVRLPSLDLSNHKGLLLQIPTFRGDGTVTLVASPLYNSAQ